MLTVVVCRWGGKYTNEHVNRLHAQLVRHLHIPFKMVAYVDSVEGLAPDIEVREVWPAISKQTHLKRPNCYRRLRLFSATEHATFDTPYILNLDLDILIVSDITPLIQHALDRGVTFAAYRDRAKNTPYNGGMWLLKVGCHHKVWATFDPQESPTITAKSRRIGSDQAWIAHVLGPDQYTWGVEWGIYAYGGDIMKKMQGELPDDATIVMMYGPYDPATETLPWVQDNWI